MQQKNKAGRPITGRAKKKQPAWTISPSSIEKAKKDAEAQQKSVSQHVEDLINNYKSLDFKG